MEVNRLLNSQRSVLEWQRRNRDAHSLQLARIERFPRARIIVHPRRDTLPEDVLGEVGWELAYDRLEANGAVWAGTFTALLRFLSRVTTFSRGGHLDARWGGGEREVKAEKLRTENANNAKIQSILIVCSVRGFERHQHHSTFLHWCFAFWGNCGLRFRLWFRLWCRPCSSSERGLNGLGLRKNECS